jgi:hypothetical protein
MTRAGTIILSVIALTVATAVITVGTRAALTALSPLRSYVCDFRLISPATCDLPMAANTTRVPTPLPEADRKKRLAYRERIIACEREKTRKRRNGEPVPVSKCWVESSAPFVGVPSR